MLDVPGLDLGSVISNLSDLSSVLNSVYLCSESYSNFSLSYKSWSSLSKRCVPTLVLHYVPGVPSLLPHYLPQSVICLILRSLPSSFPCLLPSSVPSFDPSTIPISIPCLAALNLDPSSDPSHVTSSVPVPVADPSSVTSIVPWSFPYLVPSSVPSIDPINAPSSASTLFTSPSFVQSLVPSSGYAIPDFGLPAAPNDLFDLVTLFFFLPSTGNQHFCHFSTQVQDGAEGWKQKWLPW